MSKHNHLLMVTLTPAGMKEPDLPRGTMSTKLYIVPGVMGQQKTIEYLTRCGYRLVDAMAKADYTETIEGLLVPSDG